MAHHRAQERTLATEIDSLERQLSISKQAITPAMIEKFATSLRARLREGDPNFTRAYIKLIVNRVELSDHVIRIAGTTAALDHALIKDSTAPPGAVLSLTGVGAA